MLLSPSGVNCGRRVLCKLHLQVNLYQKLNFSAVCSKSVASVGFKGCLAGRSSYSLFQLELHQSHSTHSGKVMARTAQPDWKPPAGTEVPQLKLYNSLTRKKEVFVPQKGRRVLWYSCGPTVYDASHMGHARSYISMDILRRVLQSYFNYDIYFVMNVTDIDDKIIKRARQNYLYDEFVKQGQPLADILPTIIRAQQRVEKKRGDEADPDKKTMLEKIVYRTAAAVEKAQKEGEAAKQELLSECRDALADLLDSEQGSTVTENAIFGELPKHWEAMYHQDMASLNVLPADVLTRVSEYVPEIVAYVEKIIANGFAYESNGSVYFNTGAFSAHERHFYAKLVPEAVGDKKTLQEGEGDLSVSEDRLQEKRSPNDFALWKASKPGEPSWDSPWGKGRPGWHIECSAMASCLHGQSMDIHTGGVDLKFPHHDNEIAQAEAYYGNDDWVRYFLHAGHLNIEGYKMSKSLKNFITIQDAIKEHSARQIRLLFLLHAWRDTLDYGAATMDLAKHYDKMLSEFFLTVKDIMRSSGGDVSKPEAFRKWAQREIDLNDKFLGVKDDVHSALCDSVDTRRVMETLKELVSAANIYINENRTDKQTPNAVLLRKIALYITDILKMFGAIEAREELGFPSRAAEGGVDVEETIMPYVKAFATFREDVRKAARETKAGPILKMCDQVRDDVLPELGVKLEDLEGLDAVVKLVDRETLLAEREEKRMQEEAKRLEKERIKREQAEAAAAREAQKRMPPSELFAGQMDKYSRFDERGVPTHDASGTEVPKSATKKLEKLFNAHKKKYEDHLKTQQKSKADGASNEG